MKILRKQKLWKDAKKSHATSQHSLKTGRTSLQSQMVQANNPQAEFLIQTHLQHIVNCFPPTRPIKSLLSTAKAATVSHVPEPTS